MRLSRLVLENWRAVAARELHFSEGVTLVEGPNEIGKSTLVEALRMLIEELDSSNKKSVRAIQPVGEDVGSRVEAELHCGDYHLVYRKTFNRERATELQVLAPAAAQLTGREAHERARQILEENVDLGLWNALLLEQGREIAGVSLAESRSLALALDNAAGSEAGREDDGELIARVQAAYEAHYTPRSGKFRHTGLEQALTGAGEACNRAEADMASLEQDRADHTQCLAELRRLEAALPELEASEARHAVAWQDIEALQRQRAQLGVELESADQLARSAADELARRERLREDLGRCSEALRDGETALAALAREVADQRAALEQAERAVLDAAQQREREQRLFDLARADEEHLATREESRAAQRRLLRMRECATAVTAARETLAGLRVDSQGLATLRHAQQQLQIAIATREVGCASVTIRARRELSFSLAGQALTLEAGDMHTGPLSGALTLDLPDRAAIEVVPPQSSAELTAAVNACQDEVDRLLAEYAVSDLADAVASQARHGEAERELRIWQERLAELRAEGPEEDIVATMARLQSRADTYLAGRAEAPPLPADNAAASAARSAAERALRSSQATLLTRQEAVERSREAYRVAEANHRLATQELEGLQREQRRIKQELETARTRETDADLASRAAAGMQRVGELQQALATAAARLAEASPDTAEALLDNATEATRRARSDLEQQRRERAVCEDRLTRARADGRYEALEAARHRETELAEELNLLRDQARAAKRLWETLNRHRDATRRAYVQPLREGIETLGRIVFGTDFRIELDDAWTLVSCTRAGKTVPFEALSVGMREQLGILTRLAAARMVSPEGGVPLILDDALGYSDPGRLQTMGAAIAAAGREIQIILLTCTPGRFTHVGNAEVVRL